MGAVKNVKIKGLKISPGIAFGLPFILKPDLKSKEDVFLQKEEVLLEVERYKNALEQSRQDLKYLQQRSSVEGKDAVVKILEAHLEILKDPLITEMITDRISKLKKNTETVFQQFLAEYQKNFKKEDEFFKERMNDIQDVAGRILSHLYPQFKENQHFTFQKTVVLAKELTPSMVLEFSQKQASAFVTEKGSYASHAAIIARAKHIPFIAGIDLSGFKEPFKEIIADGSKGEIIINPGKETVRHYENLILKEKELKGDISRSLETADRKKIFLFANVEDEKNVDVCKAAGIGLFRSEYLFLKNALHKLPESEKQFKSYRNVLLQMQNKPVVVRLFDIGSDKGLKKKAGEFFPKEENPALGLRAVRFLLQNPHILEEQISALLKASVFGNLHILIPLVSDLEEIRAVKKMIFKVQEKLNAEGAAIKQQVPVGSMIEVPSAALLADEIAGESDFLSIGTNDLTQYLMGADRLNQAVGSLYNFASPALIYMLHKIVKAADAHNKKVFICGEMAADPNFAELLIGLDLKNFSLSYSCFDAMQKKIQSINYKKAKRLAKKALACKTVRDLSSMLFGNPVQLHCSKM